MNYTEQSIFFQLQPDLFSMSMLVGGSLTNQFLALKKSYLTFANGGALSLIDEPGQLFNLGGKDNSVPKYEFAVVSSFYAHFLPIYFKNEKILEASEDPRRYCLAKEVVKFVNTMEKANTYVDEKNTQVWKEIKQMLKAVHQNDSLCFSNLTIQFEDNIEQITQSKSNKELAQLFLFNGVLDIYSLNLNTIKKDIFYGELLIRALQHNCFDVIEPIVAKMDTQFKDLFFTHLIETRRLHNGIMDRMGNTLLQSSHYMELFKFLKEKQIYDVSVYINDLVKHSQNNELSPWIEALKLEFSLENSQHNPIKIKAKI